MLVLEVGRIGEDCILNPGFTAKIFFSSVTITLSHSHVDVINYYGTGYGYFGNVQNEILKQLSSTNSVT